ncbi:MAG: SIMPL domain-containing protein, partial [Thermoanaerobaculia bacterium]|nr:SIMPL domain-containing protein [Thermoanaerobaculia bacterium]
AESIAEALGVTLGDVLHANTRTAAPAPRFLQMQAEMRAAADTPIEAGDLTLSATLEVTFEIQR